MSDYEDGNAAQADDRRQREWETKQCLRRVRAAGVAEDDIRDLCRETGIAYRELNEDDPNSGELNF